MAKTQFVCKCHGDVFTAKNTLREHEEKVELKANGERLRCAWPGCKFAGGDQRSLRRHEAIKHGKGVKFLCRWRGCETENGRSDNLKRHMKSCEKRPEWAKEEGLLLTKDQGPIRKGPDDHADRFLDQQLGEENAPQNQVPAVGEEDARLEVADFDLAMGFDNLQDQATDQEEPAVVNNSLQRMSTGQVTVELQQTLAEGQMVGNWVGNGVGIGFGYDPDLAMSNALMAEITEASEPAIDSAPAENIFAAGLDHSEPANAFNSLDANTDNEGNIITFNSPNINEDSSLAAFSNSGYRFANEVLPNVFSEKLFNDAAEQNIVWLDILSSGE